MKREYLGSIRIVLVEPEGPFNIGSVARVMKNMGFSDLALVKPVDYHNDEAYKGAVGARGVLESAAVYDTLEEALSGESLVVGTTRRAGRWRRIGCSLEELPGRILRGTASGGVSILFGRERCGLSSMETDLCNLLVSIPASRSFPSLNLSHAVALVCYTLFTSWHGKRIDPVTKTVSQDDIEGLLVYMEEVFSDMGFFSKGSSRYVIPLFRKVFGRALLNEEELKSLDFIFKRMHGLSRENREGGREG